MLLDLNFLTEKYSISSSGILHVGAHFGEEVDLYVSKGVKNIICFEPLTHSFDRLVSKNLGKCVCVNLALGNSNEEIEINVETANQGQSSSILAPGSHLIQYPHIKFESKEKAKMVKMDDFLTSLDSSLNFNYSKSFDFMNIDVQGYELEVLKGSFETLKNIKYIICEVNRASVYIGCAMVEEIDSFLSQFGFIRVETSWEGVTWGDAFYVKRI